MNQPHLAATLMLGASVDVGGSSNAGAASHLAAAAALGLGAPAGDLLLQQWQASAAAYGVHSLSLSNNLSSISQLLGQASSGGNSIIQQLLAAAGLTVSPGELPRRPRLAACKLETRVIMYRCVCESAPEKKTSLRQSVTHLDDNKMSESILPARA